MRKLGLFGCGNIAGIVAGCLAEAHSAGRLTDLTVAAVYDRHADRRAALAARTGARPCERFEALLEQDIDLVIEAASVAGAREHALAALQAGKDLVILSTGALMDPKLRRQLEAAAAQASRKIYLPSGAVAGLDLIRTGRTAELSRLLLRTTKPPASLGVDVTELTRVFEGSAQACIELFPRNINVAASLSIASGAPVDVEIWADPGTAYNTHEIVAEGAFGQAHFRLENHPSPDNPRTSYLAALSLVTLLSNLDSPLQIGA